MYKCVGVTFMSEPIDMALQTIAQCHCDVSGVVVEGGGSSMETSLAVN